MRGRNNGDKQRDSGRYSGLRRTPNGQLCSLTDRDASVQPSYSEMYF